MGNAPSGQLVFKSAPSDTTVSSAITITAGTDIPAMAKKFVFTGFHPGFTTAGVNPGRLVVTLGAVEQLVLMLNAANQPVTDMELPIGPLSSTSVITFTWTSAGTFRPWISGWYE